MKAFRSYLEDIEDKRSTYSSYSSHSLPRATAALLGIRPKSDQHLNISNGNIWSSGVIVNQEPVDANRLSPYTTRPRTHSCENI